MALDFFGGVTNLETLNRTQIYTLMFSAFISYFIMIMCGTLGAPRFVEQVLMECAPEVNNCSLAETLNNQIQICQASALFQTTDSEQETSLSLLVGLTDPKAAWSPQLDAKFAIYNSKDSALMDFCTSEHIRISQDHERLQKLWDADAVSKDLQFELTGCSSSESGKQGSRSDRQKSQKSYNGVVCDEVKLGKMNKKQDVYTMIKIEFNDAWFEPQTNLVSVTNYVGIQFKSTNEELIEYQANLTLIFFIVNILNAAFFVYKLTKVPKSEIGLVKVLVLQGLFILTLFNLPYKSIINRQIVFYDSFINSLTETFMLFLNLVLSHGMYASTQTTKLKFYLPKLFVSALVFLSLWVWSYADATEYQRYIELDFVVDKQAKHWEEVCMTFALILIGFYAALAAYHSFLAFAASKKDGMTRFKQQAGALLLIVSGCTVSLIVFPFESQTLQFMNENGVVNIYMIVLSYLFSPCTDVDEEILIDEDGNVSISHQQPAVLAGEQHPHEKLHIPSTLESTFDEDEQDEQGIQMKEVSSFKTTSNHED